MEPIIGKAKQMKKLHTLRIIAFPSRLLSVTARYPRLRIHFPLDAFRIPTKFLFPSRETPHKLTGKA